MKKRISQLLLGLLLVSAIAFGQTRTTTTVTTAAVSVNDQTVLVASATGITAPSNGAAANATTILYMDREEMRVIGVAGLLITVQRGSDGTPVQAHNSSTMVWVGPPSAFTAANANIITGGCTSTNYANLPIIAIGSGAAFDCNYASKWGGTNLSQSDTGYWKRTKATVAASYTASESDFYIAITDTTSARAVVLPPGTGNEGKVVVVADESCGSNSHNISVTASAGMINNTVSADVISTNCAARRYMCDGTNWFVW